MLALLSLVRYWNSVWQSRWKFAVFHNCHTYATSKSTFTFDHLIDGSLPLGLYAGCWKTEDDAENILQSWKMPENTGKHWKRQKNTPCTFLYRKRGYSYGMLQGSSCSQLKIKLAGSKESSGQGANLLLPHSEFLLHGLLMLHMYFISIPKAFFAHLTLNSYDLCTHGYKSLQLSLLIKCIFSTGMTGSEACFEKRNETQPSRNRSTGTWIKQSH